MNDRYNFTEIEPKWQQRWREARLFRAQADPTRPKFYGLEFFPYPSGSGLSVGHFKNYAPTDAFLRYKSMRGFNVLHPMGWDAFGQPAENEALKRQRNPREMVPEYAENYRRQLDLIGLSYDWEREINSSDPAYYRWTQWIFLKLFEMGLAYRATAPVNWCPVDNTVLANEEVVSGRCWRCDNLVEKRQMPQWFFRITAYAQRLIDDLDGLAWPDGIKAMQRNWIGRSEGGEVDFKVVGSDEALRVFTTRPDTLWGATFMVVAPEHPIVKQITTDAQCAEVEAYVARAQRQSEIDRLAEGKEKTGVWTGGYAVNPVNDENIPIWVADYVVMGYGTGAIMAVPAHDQRDFEFARKFGLPIVPVFQDPANPIPAAEMTRATIHEGGVCVIGPFAGEPDAQETVQKVVGWLEDRGAGNGVVNYKLRDWLISRQRYWGAPIPIIHCASCGEVPVPEDQLPVELPEVQNYQPSGTGESPLATIPEFVNTTCPQCGGPGRRETDTMGGFACSSWYFLRFADPHNETEPFSREAMEYWLPVDMYVGGAEHAVMHLLYSRFWTKALYDAGLLSFAEPFKQLRNQGMMLAHTPGRAISAEEAGGEAGDDAPIEDWKVLKPEERETFPKDQWVWRWVKMSKSLGNVVTPDEAAEQYGADALRVYEMFVVPFEDTVQWSDEGIRGCVRFLGRVWRLVGNHAEGFDPQAWRAAIGSAEGKDAELRRKTHQTILKLTEDMENFRFNTGVAALMEWVNVMYDVANATPKGQRSAALDEAIETLVQILAPIAPHMADEMWEGLGMEGFLYKHPWPQADQQVAEAAPSFTIVVQVNGKIRDRMETAPDADLEAVKAEALKLPSVVKHMEGKEIVKIIAVPGKLVNVVVK